MTTALATAQPATNPLAIIQAAVEQGVSADQLEKLMELQERFERNRAAEAFGNAITEFQRKCPQILKERTVNAGPMKYQFASYDDVMKQAGPHLSACGIALSFSTERNDHGIRVTCRVRVGIHAEDYTLDVPIPDMRVNDTQRYGAALSYAKRYALCAALNIVVTDDLDDDGQSCFESMSENEYMEIEAALDQHGFNKEKFKKHFGVLMIRDIPKSKKDDVWLAINDRIAKDKK